MEKEELIERLDDTDTFKYKVPPLTHSYFDTRNRYEAPPLFIDYIGIFLIVFIITIWISLHIIIK